MRKFWNLKSWGATLTREFFLFEINLGKIALENQELIRKEVEIFIQSNKIQSDVIIDFKFVTKKEIKALNKKYRNINFATDVLSFPIWPDLKSIPKNSKVNLGDIVIC